MKRAISKHVLGTRTFYEEDRIYGFENDVNNKKWIGFTHGDIPWYQDMINKTDTGAPHPSLGDVPGMTGLTIDQLKGEQVYDIRNASITYQLTNFGEHALHLGLYEYVCNMTRPKPLDGVGLTASAFMSDIEAALDRHVPTGTTSTTLKTGQNVIATRAGNAIQTNAMGLTPYNHNVAKLWKLKKKRKIKLNPGDEVLYKIRLKNFKYDPEKLFSSRTSVEAAGPNAIPTYIAGVTKALIIEIYGVLGRSQVAGEHSIVGIMRCDLGLQQTYRAKLLPLFNAKRFRHYEVSTDDLTGKVLVSGTEYEHKDDAN